MISNSESKHPRTNPLRTEFAQQQFAFAWNQSALVTGVGILILLATIAIAQFTTASVSNVGFFLLGALAVILISFANSIPRQRREVVQFSNIESSVKGPTEQGVLPEAGNAWSVSAQDLIGVDNTLALAKFRIDAEQTLRQCFAELGLAAPGKVFSQRRLLDEVAQQISLSGGTVLTLSEAFDVANRVIHGAEISNDSAQNVVDAGYSALHELRKAVRMESWSEPSAG